MKTKLNNLTKKLAKNKLKKSDKNLKEVLKKMKKSQERALNLQNESHQRDLAAQQDSLEQTTDQARTDREAAVAAVRNEYDALNSELERSEPELKTIREDLLHRDSSLAEKEIELSRIHETFQSLRNLFDDLSATLESSNTSHTMDVAVQSLLRSILERLDKPTA